MLQQILFSKEGHRQHGRTLTLVTFFVLYTLSRVGNPPKKSGGAMDMRHNKKETHSLWKPSGAKDVAMLQQTLFRKSGGAMEGV